MRELNEKMHKYTCYSKLAWDRHFSRKVWISHHQISAAGSRREGRPSRVRATAGPQSTSEWPRRGRPAAVNNMQPAGLSATCPSTQREPRSPQLDCQPEPLLGGPQSQGSEYCGSRVPIWTHTYLYLTPPAHETEN